tara:strand:- start:32 stop:190 length:159 start_codon:yes stop_codon:yes gene_type:complete
MNFELKTNDNIFIAGANGMVGSSIKREFLRLGFKENSDKGGILTPNRKEVAL